MTSRSSNSTDSNARSSTHSDGTAPAAHGAKRHQAADTRDISAAALLESLRRALDDGASSARVSELIVQHHFTQEQQHDRYSIADAGVDWKHAVVTRITELIRFLEESTLRRRKLPSGFVECDADELLRNSEVPPPMLVACLFGQLEIAQLLAAYEAYGQVNCMYGWRGVSPLYVACGFGHFEVVQWLVDHEAEIDGPDDSGITPIMVAVAQQDVQIARFLSDIPRNTGTVNLGATDYGKDALATAVQLGHTAVVDFLLEECQCNVNFFRAHGVTLLIEAAYFGYADIVHVLLAHGEATDLEDEVSELLCDAALRGHWGIMKVWVRNGADVNTKSTYTAYNTLSDGYDAMSILVELTPLTIAATYGNLETVKYLFEHGADVEGKTDAGETALFLAAQYGHFDVVKYLVDEQRADIESETVYKYTPVTVAASGGYTSVFQFLMSALNRKSGDNSLALRDERDDSAAVIVDSRGHKERKIFIDALLTQVF